MNTNGISASWDYNNPKVFDLSEHQTNRSVKDLGGGVKISINCVSLDIVATNRKIYVHQTIPGAYSLYYCIVGSILHIDTYKFNILAITKGDRRYTILKLEPSVVVLFSKQGLKKYIGDLRVLPSIDSRLTLKNVGVKLYTEMCYAVDDMYKALGKPQVISTLSAGTDSTLVTLALQEVGAQFHTVCVGGDNDFDPIWARRYAKHLGLDLEIIPIPKGNEQLQKLLEDTISVIECSDMSNVMMAMCTTLIRRYAKRNEINCIFHGHFADDLLGNEIFTTGHYSKVRKDFGLKPDSITWAEERYLDCLKMNPNDTQIDKVSRVDNMTWRTPFYHPRVIQLLISCPLELFSFSHKKPIYYKAIADKVGVAAWDSHHKVGYYTGTGMGKVRLGNAILSDSNMRLTLKTIKENL